MPLSHVPRPESRAAILSFVVSVLLLVIKFAAYFITGSAAIFSDAMESIVNVAASVMAIVALRVAHFPADADHPYGHGKAEFLSAGLEGGMILLASIVITIKTVDTLLFHTLVVPNLGLGVVLIGAAMVVNGAVGWHLIRSGQKHGSMTLEADGYHLLSDAITSAGAVGALALVKLLGWSYADPVAALLIAAYVAWAGYRLIRRSWAGLMDEQDEEDERLIQEILDSHVAAGGKEPRICSYHKVRHRHSGRYHWVDFHVVVPATLTVMQGHSIASRIEYEIETALGEGNATAHIEPCTEGECGGCEEAGERIDDRG